MKLMPVFSDSVLLGCFPATLLFDSDSISGEGCAYSVFRAKNNILITLRVANEPVLAFQLISIDSGILKMPGKKDVQVLISKMQDVDDAYIELELLPNPQRVSSEIDTSVLLQRITADLLNFHTIYSKRGGDNYKVLKAGAISWFGSTTLNYEDWIVELKELPETRESIKSMAAMGGYAITHKITIKKIRDELFSVDDAENILEKLRLFLSFANGAWTAPCFPRGFNTGNEIVYEAWSAPLVDPWESRLSWFDTHNAQMLSGVFAGFCRLCSTQEKYEVIKTALYWYLRSNRSSSGIDGGIILSHSSLERIATVVIERNALELPKKPSAADKIRAAAVHLNLPVSIKTNSDCALYQGVLEGVWCDFPDAINKFRNNLVHPKTESKLAALNATSDIWQAAQWLIELFILRISGYSDIYSNRTRSDKCRGLVDLVPWNEKFLAK